MIQELKDLLKKEAEQKGEEFKLDWATELLHLGYSFKDAISKLKEAGIPIVLTESEKKASIEKHNKAYEESKELFEVKKIESTADIVYVHKTNYYPKGKRIESRYSGKVMDECSITLGGENYSFEAKSGRDTVHFTANQEVTPNDGGNWDKMKYAVIISFEDLKKHSKIKNAKVEDTYTRGAVTLTENSYILCPKGESGEIQKLNPGVTVIEYEGEYVQDFANMLISELGYNLRARDNEQFDDIYYDIIKSEGIPTKNHFKSEDKTREDRLGFVYQLAGLMKLIRDEGLVQKIGKEQLIDELLKSHHLGTFIASAINDTEEYRNIFEDELRKMGITIDANEIENAIRQHVNEYGILDMDMDLIIANYLIDATEQIENKERVDATDTIKEEKRR